MEPKAVIFDLDGVLADTIEPHYQSWKVVADRLGVPFSPEDNDRLRGLSRRDSLDVLLGGKRLPDDQVFDLLDLKNDVFIESIREMSPQNLLPGALRLLQELKQANIHIGVASSSANVHVVIVRLGISEYIEAIGDRYKVSHLKPEPDLFLYTASLLGTPPEDCLVIEDSEAGVKAGQAAGMCTLGIGVPLLGALADGFFPDLEAATLERLWEVYRRWHRQRKPTTTQDLPPRNLDNRMGLRN